MQNTLDVLTIHALLIGSPSQATQDIDIMSIHEKKMNEQITETLRTHYNKTFEAHGACARGVDWRDKETAELRYRKMAQVIALAPDVPTERPPSVLDVGCGYGAQYEYLVRAGISVDYNGIDIVPGMIKLAEILHPAARFATQDLFNLAPSEQYDFVICNGVFTQKLDATQSRMTQFMDAAVARMFAQSRRGIAFNVMSTAVNYFSPNLFYRSPLETMAMCLTLTHHIAVDHAYGLYEYTTYCFKDPAKP